MLFDDFVRQFENKRSTVQLDFFHTDYILGECDLLLRDGFCLIASGTFNDTPLARALIDGMGEGWGTSIRYMPEQKPVMLRSKDGVEIPVYEHGYMTRVAILPEAEAASLHTGIGIKEVNRMNERVKKALQGIKGINDELIRQVEAVIDGTNRNIADSGEIARGADAAAPSAPDTAAGCAAVAAQVTETQPATAPQTLALDEEMVKEVIKSLLANDGFKIFMGDAIKGAIAPIDQTVNQLKLDSVKLATNVETRMAQYEKSDADKQRAYLADMPAPRTINVTMRPREARANNQLSDADKAAQTLAKLPQPQSRK